MSSRTRTQIVKSLIVEIRRFIAGVILFNETVAAEVGLNGTDLQCLHLLELQGTATPGELAKWACITTGGMTVVLDRLERAGYLVREPNPKDRRSIVIRPVPERLRKLEHAYRSKSRALARVLSKFEANELQRLLDFFESANRERVAVTTNRF
jgi:MarR family transcriptional regulator, organic hydroperoxide resistance regulator